MPASNSRNDYIFFWKPAMPHGWASQWYYSPFKARIHIAVDESTTADRGDELEFLTTEHWMMACKALIFNDTDVFDAVLAKGAEDMRAVKDLGRQVRGFDERVWRRVRGDVVFQGNLHKFRQSTELRRLLLKTEEREIVEASPRDRIWGIGFGEARALQVRNRWGLNLLGRALVDVRNALREEEKTV